MLPDVQIRDLKKLSEFIQNKYQFDFSDYAFSSFRRRVERMLVSYDLSTVDELIEHLLADPQGFERFLCEITVNTTEMFRDPGLWRYLRDEILPRFQFHTKIRIWHAGCSSGDEIYSMLIMLEEAGILDRCRIWASDISSRVLDIARSGKINTKNFEQSRENYEAFEGTAQLTKYMVDQDRETVLKPSLMEKVEISRHDLTSGQMLSRFDLILCRNVFIYFNTTLQDNVLQLFHDSLLTEGYLAIGSKESLLLCNNKDLFKIINEEEKVYQKVPAR